MATTIQTYEPKILTAGDTWKWKRKDLSTDYPSSEWTLSYQARGASTGTISITSGRDGTSEDYLIDVAASTTANYVVGSYTWDAYVTKDSERYKVRSGFWDVKQNLATALAGYDGRSWARKTLDAVEARLTGRSSNEIDRYMIGDRQIAKIPIEELMVWRSKLKAEVTREENAERIARGLPGNNLVHTRFV